MEKHVRPYCIDRAVEISCFDNLPKRPIVIKGPFSIWQCSICGCFWLAHYRMIVLPDSGDWDCDLDGHGDAHLNTVYLLPLIQEEAHFLLKIISTYKEKEMESLFIDFIEMMLKSPVRSILYYCERDSSREEDLNSIMPEVKFGCEVLFEDSMAADFQMVLGADGSLYSGYDEGPAIETQRGEDSGYIAKLEEIFGVTVDQEKIRSKVFQVKRYHDGLLNSLERTVLAEDISSTLGILKEISREEYKNPAIEIVLEKLENLADKEVAKGHCRKIIRMLNEKKEAGLEIPVHNFLISRLLSVHELFDEIGRAENEEYLTEYIRVAFENFSEDYLNVPFFEILCDALMRAGRQLKDSPIIPAVLEKYRDDGNLQYSNALIEKLYDLSRPIENVSLLQLFIDLLKNRENRQKLKGLIDKLWYDRHRLCRFGFSNQLVNLLLGDAENYERAFQIINYGNNLSISSATKLLEIYFSNKKGTQDKERILACLNYEIECTGDDLNKTGIVWSDRIKDVTVKELLKLVHSIRKAPNKAILLLTVVRNFELQSERVLDVQVALKILDEMRWILNARQKANVMEAFGNMLAKLDYDGSSIELNDLMKKRIKEINVADVRKKLMESFPVSFGDV